MYMYTYTSTAYRFVGSACPFVWLDGLLLLLSDFVFLCIYIHIYMYIYLYIYIYRHMYIRVPPFCRFLWPFCVTGLLLLLRDIYIYIYIHIIHIHIYTYIHIYIYVCVCVCVCIHIYIRDIHFCRSRLPFRVAGWSSSSSSRALPSTSPSSCSSPCSPFPLPSALTRC